MAFKEKFKTFLEESKTKILNNEEDSLGVILPTEVGGRRSGITDSDLEKRMGDTGASVCLI